MKQRVFTPEEYAEMGYQLRSDYNLDFGTAESLDDDLLAVFSHNQLIYMFGQKSIEPWFTTGVDRPPIDRQKVIERGIINSFAVTSIDDAVYWLDENRRVNQMATFEYVRIAPPATILTRRRTSGCWPSDTRRRSTPRLT